MYIIINHNDGMQFFTYLFFNNFCIMSLFSLMHAFLTLETQAW